MKRTPNHALMLADLMFIRSNMHSVRRYMAKHPNDPDRASDQAYVRKMTGYIRFYRRFLREADRRQK